MSALPNLVTRTAPGLTTDSSTANGQTFDYIIVGAGLAGTTVPARLTEDPTATVLLIESGADNRNDSRVHDIYRYGQAEITWSWKADIRLDRSDEIFILLVFLTCDFRCYIVGNHWEVLVSAIDPFMRS